MNYGRFFVMDNGASRLDKGIVVFNYRGLKDISVEDAVRTPTYPIYLTISEERISFWAHYYYHGEHLHHEILSLPLSANLEIKDGLSEALSQTYDTLFPINTPDTSDYLGPLVTDAFVRKEALRFPSYWRLPVFGIVKNDHAIDAVDLNRKFMRKLILDFIFDLEHTRIFQNCPCYEYISYKLKENYVFNALANKAMFYYQRYLINKRGLTGKNDDERNRLLLYADHLQRSESQWAKSITNGKSDEAFSMSNGWFEDPEKELNAVYANRSSIEDRVYRWMRERDYASKMAIRRMYNHSSKWYIRRYSLLSAFFPRVPHAADYRPSCYSICLVVFTLFFCCFILADSFLEDYVRFRGFPEWAYLLNWGNLTAISAIMITPYALQLLPSKQVRSRISPVVHFWGIHLFFPRLLIAIAAGWITIFFGANLLNSASQEYPSAAETQSQLIGIKRITGDGLRLGVLLALLLGCVVLFIYHQIRKINPYTKIKKRLKRTFFFGCIALIYSYLIGKLIHFLFWNESVYAFMQTPLPIDYFLYALFAMFIGVFIQLTFEEKPMTESL